MIAGEHGAGPVDPVSDTVLFVVLRSGVFACACESVCEDKIAALPFAGRRCSFNCRG